VSAKVFALPSRGARVLMSKPQLAAHLGRSTRWVELKMREGMPVLDGTGRYGGRRYDLHAVEAWLAQGKRTKPRDRVGELERRVAELAAQVAELARAS
jgi:phage terminase Nu1 subunit (DNA packaging protein)